MGVVTFSFYISLFFSSCFASEVLRPRGVSLIKTSLYDPGKEFNCLDGHGTIPFSYVNDDYCDCRDGSDEPGTSACPNGSFHCVNTGHVALDLRSSRVNDGVCDCCDASDEWLGKASCVDSCMEMGRAAREEAERRELAAKEGYTLKLGMIEQGKNIRVEKENQVAQLRNELEVAETIREERLAQKEAAEEPENKALEKYREAEEAKKEAEKAAAEAKNKAEAEEAFNELDKDSDGKVSHEEVKSNTAYDTNRDGQVTDEEVQFYLQQSDSVDFETFYSQSWRLMRGPYSISKRPRPSDGSASPSMFTPPVPPPPPPAQGDQSTTEQPDEPPADGEAEDSSEHESDEERDEDQEEEEDFDPDLDTPPSSDDVQKDEEPSEPEIVYDPETQALIDAANAAREQYQEAQNRRDELNRQMTDAQKVLDKDCGVEDEYRALDGVCFEYEDREYVYKLCPFDKATQSSRSGGGETRLGTWGQWTGEHPDRRMKYSNGQGCWNGPSRSTEVIMECGVESKLISATEPSKCEYQFVFSTPAACIKVDNDSSHAEHTEL